VTGTDPYTGPAEFFDRADGGRSEGCYRGSNSFAGRPTMNEMAVCMQSCLLVLQVAGFFVRVSSNRMPQHYSFGSSGIPGCWFPGCDFDDTLGLFEGS
jgi:hypothetical protein